MSDSTAPKEQETSPTRANVDPEKAANRSRAPRKWIKDDPVWMRKSAADTFDYQMFVKSWQYNADRPGWDYKLRDDNNVEHEDWVKETDTKEA